MSADDELAHCYAELEALREKLGAAMAAAGAEQGRADRLQEECDKMTGALLKAINTNALALLAAKGAVEAGERLKAERDHLAAEAARLREALTKTRPLVASSLSMRALSHDDRIVLRARTILLDDIDAALAPAPAHFTADDKVVGRSVSDGRPIREWRPGMEAKPGDLVVPAPAEAPKQWANLAEMCESLEPAADKCARSHCDDCAGCVHCDPCGGTGKAGGQ